MSETGTPASEIRELKLVIGSGLCEASSGGTLDVVNPATEAVHIRVPHAEKEDVDKAVQAAREAFDRGAWRRILPSERGRLLYRLSELVEKEADELALMDTRDMGKPYKHAREHDLPRAADFLRFYAGLCDKLRGSQVPSGPGKHVYLVREPCGVVAGIMPWNFPLVAAVQKLGPALACGNTTVLKPAEQSPSSTLRLGELCLEAGIPPGVVNVVSGLGETTGAALARHPSVDKIAFTGSTEVGRLIMHAAADQLRKVTLELGGKTANIVFPDSDLEAALASTIFGSFYNSGQICVTSSRLVIGRSIHDAFLEALADSLKDLPVGDPMDPKTKLGPLVSEEQYRRVRSYIEAATTESRVLVCGTDPPGNRGFYVNPTLLDPVKPDSRLAQEEIFGPVLSVIPFAEEEEALRIANQTSYGLATAIWTRDLSRAHRLAAEVDSGFVWINCNNFTSPAIAYEGRRDSGFGVDRGNEVVEGFTRLKSVIVSLDSNPHPWAGEGRT